MPVTSNESVIAPVVALIVLISKLVNLKEAPKVKNDSAPPVAWNWISVKAVGILSLYTICAIALFELFSIDSVISDCEGGLWVAF